jgi:hypothetical protein
VPTSEMVSSHHQRQVRGLLSVVVHANEGSRNAKLNWSAFKMRQYIDAGIISRENAERLLMQAAAGLAATDGEASVWGTIQSGLSATGLPSSSVLGSLRRERTVGHFRQGSAHRSVDGDRA